MSRKSIICLVRSHSLMGNVMSRTGYYRLQITIPAAVVEAIDTFRVEKKLLSRAAALRELLRLGLARNAKEPDQK
jgi:metal-responsive CopG/Arc/MetJ family transcriptional regulator